MEGPQGEIRQAVRWIGERRLENPELRLGQLVDEASRRFNLTPKQEAELMAFLKSGDPVTGATGRH